jgi:hypothetical protein
MSAGAEQVYQEIGLTASTWRYGRKARPAVVKVSNMDILFCNFTYTG